MPDETTRFRRLAELLVDFGANVQLDQIVAISAYVGDERSSSSWAPRPTTSPSSMTMISSAPMIVDTRWATMTTAASAV